MNKITEIINSPVVLDVQTGLTQAKNTIMDTVKFMVNNIAIPIICAILAGVLIFSIVGAVKLHKDGQDYSKNCCYCSCCNYNRCSSNITYVDMDNGRCLKYDKRSWFCLFGWCS